MLLNVLLTGVLISEVFSEGSGVITKPCSFPIPLELPNRNDRSDQCWLRVEDDEVVETTTVVCHVIHSFLRSYIHDYNSRKMIEDKVDVSLWSEVPRPQENLIVPKSAASDQLQLTDWKLTTILDPITRMRLYVSKNADCRIIMYSREGLSNYKVACETILYYVNERLYGSAVNSRLNWGILTACLIFLHLIIN